MKSNELIDVEGGIVVYLSHHIPAGLVVEVKTVVSQSLTSVLLIHIEADEHSSAAFLDEIMVLDCLESYSQLGLSSNCTNT
jgi:hypothetical protein